MSFGPYYASEAEELLARNPTSAERVKGRFRFILRSPEIKPHVMRRVESILAGTHRFDGRIRYPPETVGRPLMPSKGPAVREWDGRLKRKKGGYRTTYPFAGWERDQDLANALAAHIRKTGGDRVLAWLVEQTPRHNAIIDANPVEEFHG
jgi:hypothetical protein